MTKRQTFANEFKLEAVRLLNEGKKAGADLDWESGITRNRIYTESYLLQSNDL